MFVIDNEFLLPFVQLAVSKMDLSFGKQKNHNRDLKITVYESDGNFLSEKEHS